MTLDTTIMRVPDSSPVPLCTKCKLRAARPHHAVGFWRRCEPCARRSRMAEARARQCGRRMVRCNICRAIFTAGQGYNFANCSQVCGTAAQRGKQEQNKAAIIAALGGKCGCPGGPECWHAGACAIHHVDALSIDHVH